MASADELPQPAKKRSWLRRLRRRTRYVMYAALSIFGAAGSYISIARQGIDDLHAIWSKISGGAGSQVELASTKPLETGSIEPASDMPPAIAPGCIAPEQFSPLIIGKLPAAKKTKKKAVSEPAKDKPLLETIFGSPRAG